MGINRDVKSVMTVNEFIKKMRESFPNLEYRAKDKEGRVFKSRGWTNYEDKKNTTHNR